MSAWVSLLVKDEEGKEHTIALFRLPLDISKLGPLVEVWPYAALSSSERGWQVASCSRCPLMETQEELSTEDTVYVCRHPSTVNFSKNTDALFKSCPLRQKPLVLQLTDD
jgi:hypothetical protein